MLYWLAFLLSLYSRKIVGVEMMAVLQISFVAMVCFDYRSTLVDKMPSLGFSDGWNPLFKLDSVFGIGRLTRMGFTG